MFLVSNVRSLQTTVMSESENNSKLDSDDGNDPIKLGHLKYGCPFCSMIMPIPANMKKHILIHTRESAFKENQENHSKEPVKLGPQKFGCPFCSVKTSRPAEMKRHIMIHTGARPFSCKICGLTTIRKASLEKHLRVHSKK